MNDLHGSGSQLDRQLDVAIAERSLGDGVTLAASFQLGLLDRVGLKELIEFSLVAPVTLIVVKLRLPGLQIEDHRVTPLGKLNRQT